MYMKLIKISILCVLFLNVSISAQIHDQEDLKQAFDDGEYFIAYGDFQEALYNFMLIKNNGAENANIMYRIGLCYMNLEGKKKEAIPYFEKAKKSITVNYIEGDIKEVNAPIETFHYLGFAYQVSNKFDKAISNYKEYINLLPEGDEVNRQFTKQQIRACENAKKALISSENINLTPVKTLNNNFNNTRPTISGDGNTLIFLSQERFYNALYVSKKNPDNNEWTSPKNINADIMSDGDFYPVSLSYDGKILFLVKDDPFISNIYISYYVDSISQWIQLQELKNVNSRFWESGVSVSSDENIIYYSSNRRGTIGGTDIFMIEKDNKGRWGKPVNLGNNINTPFNEDNPVISKDGNRLYFSSQGHDSNLGGYDIFYVERTESGWSEPINLGYPINTPDDNIYFSIDEEAGAIYFHRIGSKEQGSSKNIYYVTF
jgi:tetratricopeptide (TPR) repeat protein